MSGKCMRNGTSAQEASREETRRSLVVQEARRWEGSRRFTWYASSQQMKAPGNNRKGPLRLPALFLTIPAGRKKGINSS